MKLEILTFGAVAFALFGALINSAFPKPSTIVTRFEITEIYYRTPLALGQLQGSRLIPVAGNGLVSKNCKVLRIEAIRDGFRRDAECELQ